jgi:hypothetical protein
MENSLTSGKTDRSLIAYAFLAQASRSDKDLLSGLAPIFKPIAKIHAGQRFDPAVFAKTLGEVYGLKVNAWAAEDLAPRLESAGLLVRVKISEQVHDYVYSEITEDYSQVDEKDIGLLVERFVEFAKPILGQHGQQLDPKGLEEAFLQQLIDTDFVGILLKPEQLDGGSSSHTLTLKKPPEQVSWKEATAARSRIEVLCAAFTLDVYHRDPKLYDLIVRVTTGALISEVVLNLQDPGKTGSLDGLTIVLDTPFLMSVLNLSSEESYLLASAMCDQLRDKGAALGVFSHSVDELKDNLKAVIGSVRSGEGFGPTARRLTNHSFQAYASSLMQNPEPRLKQDQIRIVQPPKGTTSLQYFTVEDEDAFKRSLGYYENALAQERDAASIAAVIRLRYGQRPKMGRFPNARYVFLTGNPWLAERSHDFLVSRNLSAVDEVPPAFTDRYLAGLLWVIYGGKAKELPRHVLLANCAAAVEPRSDVIKQMHRFLADLDGKQAEYFRALMTEERAGQYLMQLTLGESAFLTRDNAPVILEQIKNSLIEKHESRLKAELEDVKRAHEAKLAEEQNTQRRLREELFAVEANGVAVREALEGTTERVGQLEAAVAAERNARTQDKKRLIDRCIQSAVSRTNAAHLLVALFVAGVSVFATWLGMHNSLDHRVQSVSATIVGILAFLGFWKVPDYLFGGWMTSLRNAAYQKKLKEFGLEKDAQLFAIDWKSRRASLRPNKDKR